MRCSRIRRRAACMPVRMAEPSALVPWSEAAHAYAAASLSPGRAWLEAVSDLMRRIHREFEFKPGATTVQTSVDEVLDQRSGVCQDFAHVMLAALRSHGLPARYVSGYLLTRPPPGRPRLSAPTRRMPGSPRTRRATAGSSSIRRTTRWRTAATSRWRAAAISPTSCRCAA